VSSLNKCIKAASGNVITCRGRLAYANGLFEKQLPQGETDPKKAKFQTSIVFPKGSDLTELNNLVEACATEAFGKDYKAKHKVRKPFLRVEDNPKVGVTADEYEVLIRTNSPTRPQVIRADKSAVNEDQKEEAYSGRWARISVRCYAYDHKTGGKGVSFGLQNVQLLDHAEPLGSVRPPADEEFEAAAIEGGEAAQSTDSLFT
jgi:hypothetical protein